MFCYMVLLPGCDICYCCHYLLYLFVVMFCGLFFYFKRPLISHGQSSMRASKTSLATLYCCYYNLIRFTCSYIAANYGRLFNRISNHVLTLNHNRNIPGLPVEECARRCIMEMTFRCQGTQ